MESKTVRPVIMANDVENIAYKISRKIITSTGVIDFNSPEFSMDYDNKVILEDVELCEDVIEDTIMNVLHDFFHVITPNS